MICAQTIAFLCQYFLAVCAGSEYIEKFPLANTPEVFGLHPNAEIGYYTNAAKEIWTHLMDLQPQTGREGLFIDCALAVSVVVSSIFRFIRILRVNILNKDYLNFQDCSDV